LTADRVSCLIRCENSDAADFVSEHLEKLRGKLRATGLEVERLDCREAADLHESRERFLMEKLSLALADVNLFA